MILLDPTKFDFALTTLLGKIDQMATDGNGLRIVLKIDKNYMQEAILAELKLQFGEEVFVSNRGEVVPPEGDLTGFLEGKL